MAEQTLTFGGQHSGKTKQHYQTLLAYAKSHPESRCLWLCMDRFHAQEAFQQVLSSDDCDWKEQIEEVSSMRLTIRLKNNAIVYFIAMDNELVVQSLRGLNIHYVGIQTRLARMLSGFYSVIYPRASVNYADITTGDDPLSSPEPFF